MTSSSVTINAPTEILSRYIYFDAFEEDKVRIRCNACGVNSEVFFEGNDWEHIDVDWLKMGIEHLFEKHYELFVPA